MQVWNKHSDCFIIYETGFPICPTEPSLSLGCSLNRRYMYDPQCVDLSSDERHRVLQHNDILRNYQGVLTFRTCGPHAHLYGNLYQGMQPVSQQSFARFRGAPFRRAPIVFDLSYTDPYPLVLELAQPLLFMQKLSLS